MGQIQNLMRYSPRLFLASLLCLVFLYMPKCVLAESIRVLVQSSPLAGSQYYDVNILWEEMHPGDALTLVREPDNRYDRRAVRIEWRGHKLGYVPRKSNRLVAEALDRGETLEAKISRLRDDPDPWQRLEFEIYLRL